jgi:Mg-chelatase subunit ChlD
MEKRLMRNDLTDVTLVIDRSGSMASMRTDAEGGINSLVAAQAKQPGECRVTLVQFDSEYEVVHQGILASDWPGYCMVPRGSTALLDAVGKAINETGARLAAMPESQRPGLVVFVICTDGQENSSHEFTHAKVREMIEYHKTQYQWQFTFLAANPESFAEAGRIGLNLNEAVMHAAGKAHFAHDAMAYKLVRMREQASSGETIRNEFTPEERKQME